MRKKGAVQASGKRGFVIIISGPSGVGKGTVIRELLTLRSSLNLAISATTRKPRIGEKEGVEYYFLSKEAFDREIGLGHFVEWCEVHGNIYGTYRKEVDRYLDSGQNVILEIDIQGAEKVRAALKNVVSIFLEPPSLDHLGDRLKGRNTEKKKDMELRLTVAERELKAKSRYDVVIVNEDSKKTAKDILKFIDTLKSKE